MFAVGRLFSLMSPYVSAIEKFFSSMFLHVLLEIGSCSAGVEALVATVGLLAKNTHFGRFGGYRKWHFGCLNQNSKTTFQYKYPP